MLPSPVLDLLVLPLVLGHVLCLVGGLAGEFKALFNGAEKFRRHVVHVLQGRHDVGRAGDGLKQLNSLQGVCNLVHIAFQPVPIPDGRKK